MREEGKELLATIRLEYANSYRFPIIETILIFFLVLSLWTTNSLLAQQWHISLYPSEGWDGTEWVAWLRDIRTAMAPTVYGNILNQLNILFYSIIPLLIGFTTAKAFEDGTIRVFLSYPIRRGAYMIAQFLLAIMIIGGGGFLAALGAMAVFVPFFPIGWSVLLLTVSFWTSLALITSSVMLIAVISGRSAVTAVGGIALWNILLLLATNPLFQIDFARILNPMQTSYDFVMGLDDALQYSDVLFSLGTAAFLIVIALIFIIVLFKQKEV